MFNQSQRGFNIARFNAYTSSTGLMHNNTFLAIFPYPAKMDRKYLTTEQNLELACDLINFPSTGVQTYPVQRYSYGVIETKPTIPKFSPLQCTFICDRNTDVQRFFHEWVRTAVNFDYVDGSMVTQSAMYGTPYEIGYKVDYAVDIHLQMYDYAGTMVKEIRFREAYPTDVGDAVLAWSRQNEVLKIPVMFTFLDWSDVTTRSPTT